MSGGLDILSLKEDDITKMLVATTHLGSENVNFQMEQYVFKRRADGVNIINLGKTWEKLVLAARAIVAIENASDVSAFYWILKAYVDARCTWWNPFHIFRVWNSMIPTPKLITPSVPSLFMCAINICSRNAV